MKVLVTGASGMYGSAVARFLTGRGDEVRVFQRRPSGIAGVDEHLGDVTDPAAVREAVDGVDAVIHLAGLFSMNGPWESFVAVNIEGVRNVLAAARAAGVGRFVHISSPSVAHHGRSLVGAGAGPADPHLARGNYARSKAEGELLALAADAPGLSVVVLRPHLMWGPGDTQLVGRIVERARIGRLQLVGSGTALMDTLYVDNAAESTVAAVDRAEVAHGEALVVTNGEPRPIAELIERICAAAGVPPPRMHVPVKLAWGVGGLLEMAWPALRRDGDPLVTRFLAEQMSTAHWFDQRRTQELLDWEPRVDLEEGIARLATWYASTAVDSSSLLGA